MKKFVKIKGVAAEAWHLIDVNLIAHAHSSDSPGTDQKSSVCIMDRSGELQLHSSWDVPAIFDEIAKVQAEGPLIQSLKAETQTLTAERDRYKALYKAASDLRRSPERAPVSEAAQDLEEPKVNEELKDQAVEYYVALGRTMDLTQAELGHLCASKMAGFIWVLLRTRVKGWIHPVKNRGEIFEKALKGHYVNILIMPHGHIELRHYTGELERYRVIWTDWKPKKVPISPEADNPDV